jgi:hypothetical protein
MWRNVHLCIRTNGFRQLTELLSKHTINLNSFNLSTDGDTILHSAAKSNDVKMIEFVLQRISPSTKQRMLKMKNKRYQLPGDLLTVWTPLIHSLFPLKFRQVVKAVLMLAAKRQDGTLKLTSTNYPKIFFIILQYAALQISTAEAAYNSSLATRKLKREDWYSKPCSYTNVILGFTESDLNIIKLISVLLVSNLSNDIEVRPLSISIGGFTIAMMVLQKAERYE